jgi:hypothetical protein
MKNSGASAADGGTSALFQNSFQLPRNANLTLDFEL